MKRADFGFKMNFSVVHSFPCFAKCFGGKGKSEKELMLGGIVLVFW